MSGPFEARYPGTCADCEELIEPGEQITSLGKGEYEHVTCRASADRPAVICESCWLAKPCDCEADR